MTDETTEFFESLRRRGHDPLLRHVTGTVAFDLRNGHSDKWSLAIDKGDLAVTRAARKADSTLRADKALFEKILRGEVHALAAVLRGEVTVEGDPELLLMFQRLLPAPERATVAGNA